MIESLLKRDVQKRSQSLRFTGRLLFLTEDPELVKRQLGGTDLDWSADKPDMKLRDNISTDEITPGYVCYYFDETLGEFPYVGLKCGDELPIGRNAIKNGGFAVSVSGKRRGKGSSREQSPYAELTAGIQVVIAENIERIYNQNCQNLGVLTSTNFGLLEKLKSGEEIPLAEFTAGVDDITRQIIEYGGLFSFNIARLQGKVSIPEITTAPRPMTLAEKIFARHMVANLAENQLGVAAVKPGDAGFVRVDWRFSHEYVTPMAASFFEQYVGKSEKVTDPDSILLFRDHLTFLDQVMPPAKRQLGLLDAAAGLAVKQEEFAREQGIRLHGELTDRKGSEAICHSKMLQSYALPGQILVGSDSHTPHSGALGCIAFGIGTTDVFNAWITKDVRVTVPKSVKIVVHGQKPASLTAKDFMLEILRHPYVKNGEAIGTIVEYTGEAVAALSIDERATMTNMAAEVGAFTGIVAADEKTVEFLVSQRGMARAEAEALCAGMQSDPDAEYVKVIEIDASAMRPLVALPGDPGNGVAIDELHEPVKVDIAYGGSCTGGKIEDMDLYVQVFREALAHGKRVADGVDCFIQFGSQEVRDYCLAAGYLEILEKVGAQVIEPSCGACISAGPGVSTSAEQVTISAINRNFPGRSGPGQMYLASPLTVAASAIAGYITEYKPV
ncbi:MAG: 3-isopropylmalate dehydratase [Blastocatellia bacterium]|nr:3-isopropylmalate dehydratase [Blastocatellia bacterium]